MRKSRRRSGPRSLPFAVALLLAGRLSVAQEKAANTVPSATGQAQAFPTAVEQVTVDVVVVDKKGEPVTGLTKNYFTITDEGQVQAIASFDVVRPPAAAAARATPERPLVATNVLPPAERGRLFVVVFDDVHLSPLNARRAKAAVLSFLEKGLQDGDRVLLFATSGEAWWSTRMPEGRADLVGVLKHLEGRHVPDNALERLTDYEAIQISVYHDATVAARVQDRLDRYGTSSRQGMQQSQQQQAVQNQVPGVIDPYIEMRANETYTQFRTRIEVTLGILERSFKALADTRDRKAVILVSEGFAYDSTIPAYRKAVEAARRANVALYFIDTRGLETMQGFYGAEFGPGIDERNLLSAIADVSYEGEGSANLAADTGGFSVRSTNDFAAGAVRIGRESSSYYLIGYNPGEIPRNEKFRKIEVKVSAKGKGWIVRARKGYFAPGPVPEGGEATPAPGATAAIAGVAPRIVESKDPELQHALDSPGFSDAIPLRMTAFTLDPLSRDQAQVVLAAEADVARTLFGGATGNAVLDTLLVLSHRETGELFRSDVKVELQRRPGTPPAGQPIWYAFARPFQLKAGTYQAKLVVRDAAASRVGSLIYEFEVPSLDMLRVSSPILSDVLQDGGNGGPALLVRRSFASGATLYCRFDVYGAKPGPNGKPQVMASHELRRRDGTSMGRSEPRIIEPTSLGALARLIQIPLQGVVPGDYDLVIGVHDELSGDARELVQPFTVTAGAVGRAAR